MQSSLLRIIPTPRRCLPRLARSSRKSAGSCPSAEKSRRRCRRRRAAISIRVALMRWLAVVRPRPSWSKSRRVAAPPAISTDDWMDTVRCHRPRRAAIPLVLDSPHSGTEYPRDFEFAAPLAVVRQAEDTYVAELYAAAPDVGATLIEALFPRAYIDPNRHVLDM